MLQTIITYCIVLIAFLIVSYRIYKAITRKQGETPSCGGCTGCDLKNEILKNKKQKSGGCIDLKDKKE
ncbi:MAG: FeoB-associated Cys-rich membrane protein [Bacteroidales bacterium]